MSDSNTAFTHSRDPLGEFALDESLALMHRHYVANRPQPSATAKRYAWTESPHKRPTPKKHVIAKTRVKPSESISLRLVYEYYCPVISDDVPNGTMEWRQIPATLALHLQA